MPVFIFVHQVRQVLGLHAVGVRERALEAGQTYFYTVRVETNRDGQPVSETRRVLVRANEVVRESFSDAKATVVTSR